MQTNNKINHETTAINKSVASYKLVYNKFVMIIGAMFNISWKKLSKKRKIWWKYHKYCTKIANFAEFAENAKFCGILRETANFAADLKFCDFACDFANANFWGL